MHKYPTLGPGDLPGDRHHPNSPDYDGPEFTMQDLLEEHWTDDDTTAVQAIMGDYMDGPRDGFAKAKMWRQIEERAELVVSRA